MEVNDAPRPEKPSGFWYKVYAAAVVSTIVVVAALWAFSRYFS